jgi:hypothetical protein
MSKVSYNGQRKKQIIEIIQIGIESRTIIDVGIRLISINRSN